MTKAKKFICGLVKEGFMQPEIFRSKGVAIDTIAGTFYFPDDVINSKDLDFKGRETTDKEVIKKLWGEIGDYLEVWKPEKVHSIERIDGWFGRLTAPGYLDSTDFIFSVSREKVEKDLEDLYGDDLYDDDDDNDDDLD